MMHAVRAEWNKLWFPKSSRLYLPLAVAASVLTALLFSFTTKITQNRALSELAPLSVLEVNMLGVDVSAILLVFFAAVQTGREFQGKSISIYLAAMPRRSRYFAAKALTFSMAAFAVAVTVALFALLNGQLILTAVHGQRLFTPQVWQLAAGCAVMPPFYVLLAVCATVSSRSAAAGIAAPVAVLLLPALAELFPKALRAAFVPSLPASAIHTLAGIAQKGSLEYTGIVEALIILASWGVSASLLALWKFRKKDL